MDRHPAGLMSFGMQQARAFFAPLTGRTTTFLLEDREANLGFASTIMGLLAQTGDTCAVVDLDAFYSSNSDRIFGALDQPAARATAVRVPEPGADIEGEFSAIFEAPQKTLIMDSLNSFYHLVSQEDGSSRSRKLMFAVASLSYFARVNGKVVIFSMYRREGFTRGGTGRSISSLSDMTASVDVRGEEMTVRRERGSGWPGGRFSIRIPSG